MRDITESFLAYLLQDRVPEGRDIEYKRDLPDSSDKGKYEYLSDVSSFANSSGGHIIFGVDASNGIPTSITGVATEDVDATLLRLEAILRNNLSPTLPGLHIYPLGSFSNGPVVVISMRQSWIGPHMITYKRSAPFFMRTSAGKSPMTIDEIKTSVLGHATLPQTMREFRQSRHGIIAQGRAPLQLSKQPYLLIHIMPIASFLSTIDLDVKAISQDWFKWKPFGREGGSYSNHINLDGVVAYHTPDNSGLHHNYCQLFRNGIVEVLNAWLTAESEGLHFIYTDYEVETINGLMRYCDGLRSLSVEPPYFVFVTFNRMRKVRFYLDHRRSSREIDREYFMLSEIETSGLSAELPRDMKPVFDQVANAFGIEGAFNYDEAGNWIGATSV